MDWKKIVSVGLGLFLFCIILFNANLEKTAEIITKLELNWFFAAVILNLTVVLVKSLKWKILVDYKEKLPFNDAIRFFLIGFFFSTITPGRIGDLVRAKYIRKKTGLAYATTSVVLDRLIDIGLLLGIGLIAVIVSAEIFGFEFFSPLLIGLVIIVAGLSIYAFSKKSFAEILFKPISKFLVPEKMKAKANDSFENLYNAIEIFKKNRFLLIKASALGVVIWGISITSVFFLSNSISTGIPFYGFFIIVPLMALSDLIPLSVGGLGPREFITINALAIFSVGYEMAVAFSIIYFFAGYVFIATIGGLVYFLKKIKTKEV